ncbi:MAG TPA: 2-phospho-L-lactate transferase CofD family protein, partial [Nitrososphaerales archaeon]|nr:2-phospho-L-lactate transferase CofD family protein [Nitrososphaerales archaeon]
MTRLGVICGGSGSSKFAISLGKYAKEKYDLGFVCNVGDNFWYHGLYVCPDIDIITYALSGRLDESKGWGLADDSSRFLKGLKALGFKEWFNLGDEDMALSVVRTELLRKGHTLSQITQHVSESLGIDFSIMPSTDDNVETYIFTSKGKLHLQEYWVKLRASPKVHGVDYFGIRKAVPNPEALKFLSQSAIICPANPITSILPTLNIPGMRKALKQSKIVAVSPFIGKK